MSRIIWYISKYASPLKYGFASRHFYLASEFNQLGNRTVVISSNSNHLAQIPDFQDIFTKEEIEGVETLWIKSNKYDGSASFRRIISWIDFELKLLLMPKNLIPRPDVIIVSSLSLLTILNGYRLKKRYGCKLIFEVRDIWPLTIIEEGNFNRWNPFVMVLSWIEKFGYRHSDVIVGTMPNLAEHVKAVTKNNLNCYCIPFGFDPSQYIRPEPLPEGYEERYIPKNKFIIGYTGSIGLTNALDPIIKCSEILKDDPDIHFLLVGDGDMLNKYTKEVKELRNITFAPKVRKLQVQSILSHCDVLYFSVKNSKVWRYGLSLNKLIDYMFAGKPIIASYSGYPSMVNEAECGSFVPAGDVSALINTLYTYKELANNQLESIGKKGKEWLLLNRSYKKIALDYSKLF
jgi:glycosyltransferase involved in cell wall biosynthesis